MVSPQTTPEEVREDGEMPGSSGVNTPKADVTQPVEGEKAEQDPSSVETETARAEDTHPAGLTASETVRYETLNRQERLSDEERQELTDLGYKRDHGMPQAQHKAIKTAGMQNPEANAAAEVEAQAEKAREAAKAEKAAKKK